MLDGQVLHGRDRYGWWQVLTMEGWDATPEPKTDAADRVNGDGEVDTEVHYSRRLVTLTGRLIAKSPEQAEEARTRLTGLLHQGGIFSVTSGNGTTKWGNARRGRIVPGPIRGRYLTFQMELRFPDPYKYGSKFSKPTASGVAMDLLNRGNSNAWPVVTVTGSSPGGYEMSIGDHLVQVIAPLVSGKPHVVNMRTGRLTVDGDRVYGAFGICELFSVSPGLAQSFYPLAVGGSATFKVEFNDTYI